MILKGLVGPSYRSASKSADPAECINWFVEGLDDANAKAPSRLCPTPGFTDYADLDPGPIRCVFTSHDGRLFVVSGFNFYEIQAPASAVLRGTVALDANPATICSNGAAGGQLFITSGDLGYCYDLGTNTLTTVLLAGAAMGAYLSNVFIALNTDLSLIRISELDDGLTWDPTQFAQRSLAADPWVSMTVVNSELWMLGSQTSEVWANLGLFPFPFAPIQGAFFNVGNAAPFSAKTVDSVLVWVAQSAEGVGWMARSIGYAAQRISTHAVEFAIQSYANLADAVSWSYTDQGHKFWTCNFIDGARSWSWDLTTGLWHERGYWNTTTALYEAMRVGTHGVGFSGAHIVGDRVTGQLYTMADSVATDVDGQGIRRQRIFRGVDDEEFEVFYPWLQIDMETGIGIATGQGQNPQAMLQISRDGGFSWGAERWESIGRMGQYFLRVVWRRLGRARNAVFKLVVSDPVYPVTLLQGILRNPVKGLS